MNRVVITGMGVYSCIGLNKEAVLDSLMNGRSGIVFDQERKDFGYRSGLVGLVPRPDLKSQLDRRARIMLPEEGEFHSGEVYLQLNYRTFDATHAQ